MQIASLGSGSKGNATLVKTDQSCVLIDCGFSLLQFERRLQRMAFSAQQIDTILVTHEHSDHGSGVFKVAQKYNIPVRMTVGTARALDITDFVPINSHHDAFEIADMTIQPVTVPHDAAEPVQFVFTDMETGRKLGVLTDSGHISTHIQQAYEGVHGLLLEFNYDDDMLQQGPYPEVLKHRIAGQFGHLSNLQSLQMLQQMEGQSLEYLIAAHISEKNNSPQIVDELLSPLKHGFSSQLACQQQGFDWVSV